MGVVSQCLRLAIVAGVAIVVAGCGGSVADADAPLPTRPARTAQSGFCQAAQASTDAVRALNLLVARGNVRADELRLDADAVRRTGTDFVESASSDIRKDVQRVVDALNQQVDALVAAGGVPPTSNPQLATQLNAPELVSASQRVTAYVTANCGRVTSTR